MLRGARNGRRKMILPTIQLEQTLKIVTADDPSYSNPRWSGYLACKELTSNSN
jgi:hypothetical protein